MIELLIIADDFTGALDTGVQFSSAGFDVRVVTVQNGDFATFDVDVLVIDSETRHLDSEAAYKIVFDIVKRAVDYGIPCIYKKTDSAMRGNIGSELQAVLDASGEMQLPFIPALPSMNRITRHGIHYIDGVPVQDSVFGQDPFEPVTRSYVPDLIKLSSPVKVRCIPEQAAQRRHCVSREVGEPEILLFDVTSEESLIQTVAMLKQTGKTSILAGCSGLASAVTELLDMEGKSKAEPFERKSNFLVACGSVNPITRCQLAYAERHGFQRQYLTPEQKIKPQYWESEKGMREKEDLLKNMEKHRCFIIDTNDFPEQEATLVYASADQINTEELRSRITDSLGTILADLLDLEIDTTLMVMGGDTLMGFFNTIGVTEVEPIAEILPGTVLSRFRRHDKTYQILSKSGGFGEEALLVQLAQILLDA